MNEQELDHLLAILANREYILNLQEDDPEPELPSSLDTLEFGPNLVPMWWPANKADQFKTVLRQQLPPTHGSQHEKLRQLLSTLRHMHDGLNFGELSIPSSS